MSLSDLLVVTECAPLDPPLRVPVHVEPQPGEALWSWIARLGEAISMPPLHATRTMFGIDGCRRPNWWRRPSAGEIAAVADRTGIAAERLRAMTFLDWTQARDDERFDRFGRKFFQKPGVRARTWRTQSLCPACLQTGQLPRLDLIWAAGWTAICPKHQVVLVDRCPRCSDPLRLRGLDSRTMLGIGHCSRCGDVRAELPLTPAAAAVCVLQAGLLAVKRSGHGSLDGIGAITWATFVSFADIVRTAIWHGTTDYRRERLFGRVVTDTGLDQEARLHTDWPSNYGFLLVAAWMLADWPRRIEETTGLLRTPSVAALLALMPDNGAGLDEHAVALATQGIPMRRSRDEIWRHWLETLPETAEMLWDRYRAETRQPRMFRLAALAHLRAGADVIAAAREARASVTAVERWLDLGVDYGLQFLLRDWLRISELTEAEASSILGWLKATPRATAGWSTDHLQHEIAERFGLPISTLAVRHLLTAHFGTHRRRTLPRSAFAPVRPLRSQFGF
ncbi:MAG: TniQ family protein [Pseudomonadota bacterium]|nr:TniQ family protein [Pseudomonadota bacterium]